MRRRVPAPAFRVFWALCAVLLVSCEPSGQPVHAPERAALQALTFQPLELSFASRVPLEAAFVSQGGRTIKLLSYPEGERQVFRFTPTEAGNWSYRVHASGASVAQGEIDAEANANSRGFIRARGHHLEFADGTPFIAIGENRINIYDPSWNWKALPIAAYVRHMADHGMMVVRVFIVSDIENEERGGTNSGVLEPTLGRFDPRMAAKRNPNTTTRTSASGPPRSPARACSRTAHRRSTSTRTS